MGNGRLAQLVDDLPARGRYTFDRGDAAKAAGEWDPAARDVLRRLQRQRRVARPRHGFYVIVPPEYRAAGAPPASWFVHDLMKFLGQPYYIGLLSAAAIHGASHQKPQELQVITDRPTREVSVGRSRIRFVRKNAVRNTPVQDVKTETGYLHASTPEATALDLARYPGPSGGVDNVATVLSELAESIDAVKLHLLARKADRVVDVQRLGYLLEFVGEERLTEAIGELINARRPEPAALVPGADCRGARFDSRWRLRINFEVEPDL